MRALARRASFTALALTVVVIGAAACGGSADRDSPSGFAQVSPAEPEPPRPATGPSDPGGETVAGPAAPVIEVRDGEPVGGVATIRATKGERVRFEVRSDVADEVHVHGFDLSEPVRPGEPARVSFVARLDGIFEVELEELGVEIAQLRVDP